MKAVTRYRGQTDILQDLKKKKKAILFTTLCIEVAILALAFHTVFRKTWKGALQIVYAISQKLINTAHN